MAKVKASYEFLSIYERHIFYGNDVKAIFKLIDECYKKDEVDLSYIEDDNLCHGFVGPVMCKTNPEKIRAYVMFVRDNADVGTVAHEATHLVNFIFSYLGQELDIANDEVQAYLLGHVTQQFMTRIRGAKPSAKSLI